MTLLAAWGWIWSTTQHMLALLLLPFYGPMRWRWRAGKLDIWVRRAVGHPGGQTLGQITFWLVEPSSALVIHEDRHTLQSAIFGPLMIPLYPLGCLMGALGGHWHDANPFELDAYKVSGVR